MTEEEYLNKYGVIKWLEKSIYEWLSKRYYANEYNILQAFECTTRPKEKVLEALHNLETAKRVVFTEVDKYDSKTWERYSVWGWRINNGDAR